MFALYLDTSSLSFVIGNIVKFPAISEVATYAFNYDYFLTYFRSIEVLPPVAHVRLSCASGFGVMLSINVKRFCRILLCLLLWQIMAANDSHRQLTLLQGVAWQPRTFQYHTTTRLLQATMIQQRWTQRLCCQLYCHRNNLFHSVSSLTKVLYVPKCFIVTDFKLFF